MIPLSAAAQRALSEHATDIDWPEVDGIPSHLWDRGKKEGKPISRTMRSALELIKKHSSIDWTERDGGVTTAYETVWEGVNLIGLSTATALFDRKLIAVDLGPICRSLTFFLTPQGCKELGLDGLGGVDWEDSGNHL